MDPGRRPHSNRREVLLYRALGFAPQQVAHLSLVLVPLTPALERHGATSVAEFRERGYLPRPLELLAPRCSRDPAAA